MIRNKKADVGTLALLIIVLASSSVLGGFVYKWASEAKEESKIEACRLSILRAAQEKRVGIPGVKKPGVALSKLDCPRGELGDIIIRKKDVVEDDKINQDKTHRMIAEGMRECWRMAGEGTLDPFSYWSDDTYEGQSLCLQCKEIIFDDDLTEWMAKKQKKIVKDELGIDLKDFGNTEEDIKRLEQEVQRVSSTLSLQKKKDFEEKYLNYVITSPIHYMQTTNMPGTRKTYWEYLYNEEAAKLSVEDLEKLKKTQLLPNSIILVRLYRTEVKDPWWWATIKWVGGALLVVGVIVLAIVLLPASIAAVAVAIIAKVGGFLAVVLKAWVVASLILGLGTVAVYEAGVHTYSNCPDCNGIGGVVLIHPDIMPLGSETKVCLKERCESEDDFTDVKICNLLVN
ncbi:hypothetical protein KY343_00680 [Candidatus Woesearchaeota archaeon]|nr:hypothetical protein [Candidatus Woesearchaeota archaeon]